MNNFYDRSKNTRLHRINLHIDRSDLTLSRLLGGPIIIFYFYTPSSKNGDEW